MLHIQVARQEYIYICPPVQQGQSSEQIMAAKQD